MKKLAVLIMCFCIAGNVCFAADNPEYSARMLSDGLYMRGNMNFDESDTEAFLSGGKTLYNESGTYGDKAVMTQSAIKLAPDKGKLSGFYKKVEAGRRYTLFFRVKSCGAETFIGVYDGNFRMSLTLTDDYITASGDKRYGNLWERHDELAGGNRVWYDYAVRVDNGVADIYRKPETRVYYTKILENVKLSPAAGDTFDFYVMGEKDGGYAVLDYAKLYNTDSESLTVHEVSAVYEGDVLRADFDIEHRADGISNYKVFAVSAELLDDADSVIGRFERSSGIFEDTRRVYSIRNADFDTRAAKIRYTVTSGGREYDSGTAYVR